MSAFNNNSTKFGIRELTREELNQVAGGSFIGEIESVEAPVVGTIEVLGDGVLAPIDDLAKGVEADLEGKSPLGL
jgi:hypothetical protein